MTLTQSLTPVSVAGLSSGVANVSTGFGGLTCAAVSSGIQCWGYNGTGQLGNNSTTNSSIPLSLPGISTSVQALSVGTSSACTLSNGAALCWGLNSYGQLGTNTTDPSHIPATVFGLGSGM